MTQHGLLPGGADCGRGEDEARGGGRQAAYLRDAGGERTACRTCARMRARLHAQARTRSGPRQALAWPGSDSSLTG